MLDQQDIASLGVGKQAKQLWPGEFRPALVFDVLGRDGEPAFGGKGFELGAGTRRVLLAGAGSKIGPDEHGNPQSLILHHTSLFWFV